MAMCTNNWMHKWYQHYLPRASVTRFGSVSAARMNVNNPIMPNWSVTMPTGIFVITPVKDAAITFSTIDGLTFELPAHSNGPFNLPCSNGRFCHALIWSLRLTAEAIKMSVYLWYQYRAHYSPHHSPHYSPHHSPHYSPHHSPHYSKSIL